jgi:hypothetical protein
MNDIVIGPDYAPAPEPVQAGVRGRSMRSRWVATARFIRHPVGEQITRGATRSAIALPRERAVGGVHAHGLGLCAGAHDGDGAFIVVQDGYHYMNRLPRVSTI